MSSRTERRALSVLINACIVGLAVAAFNYQIEGARTALTMIYWVFGVAYVLAVFSQHTMAAVAVKGPTWSRTSDPLIELAIAAVFAWFGAWWPMGVQLLGFALSCKLSELRE